MADVEGLVAPWRSGVLHGCELIGIIGAVGFPWVGLQLVHRVNTLCPSSKDNTGVCDKGQKSTVRKLKIEILKSEK